MPELKKKYIIIIKLILAIGLIWYLFTKFDYDEIINNLSQANYKLVILAFSFTFINLIIQFKKWQLSCNLLLNEINKKEIYYSLFYGFTAAVFTPMRVGEYLGRALTLKKNTFSDVIVTSFLDKLFPLIILTFSGSISSIIFLYVFYGVTNYLIYSMFLIVMILFVIAFSVLFNPKSFKKILPQKSADSKLLNKIAVKIRILNKLTPSYIFKMLFYSLLQISCYLVQYSILAVAFSNKNNFLKYMWAGILTMFTKTIIPSLTLGDLGIREGSSVFYLSKMGADASVGFNAAIFLFFINVLFPALIGLFLLIRKNDD